MNGQEKFRELTIQHIELASYGPFLTRFEAEVYQENSRLPIADYARTLRKLREGVKAVATQREEIEFAVGFQRDLADLATRHNLAADHFSVDTAGDPLLVKEGDGEHLISPTHFENGAYFSHPHADHQLGISADRLPRLKVGRYVRFGRNSAVNAGGDVTIGDGAWLSPGSQLLRQDHDPYGRPSVGSRTVAMTQLPPIVLGDYGWVGREAIVGWGADYLGKCSIVATRAFINKWVGDYSIVGDHGKIIQYAPFKAYLLEHCAATFEDVLAVTDWAAVNSDWIAFYRQHVEPCLNCDVSDLELLKVPGSTLVIEASGPKDLVSLGKRSVDYISRDRRACASILQWCLDHGTKAIRFRGDFDGRHLPFGTSGNGHYLRRTGYELVICHTESGALTNRLVDEISRVALPGAIILIKSRALASLDVPISGGSCFGRLLEKGEAKLGGESFAILAKVE